MSNSFNSRRSLEIGEYQYQIYALEALEDRFDLDRLPYTHKILLENLLRFEDGMNITKEQMRMLHNLELIDIIII